MNPTCRDIAQIIDEDTPLGLTLGTDLFYGRMPDGPSNCVAVFDNPGDAPMLTLKKATSNYFYSSINVRVRHTEYAAGWAIMQNIVTLLHGLNQQDSPDASCYIGVVKAINDPQVLYWDKNDRVIFFTHFEVQRKPN
jgi:hypothetical protein